MRPAHSRHPFAHLVTSHVSWPQVLRSNLMRPCWPLDESMLRLSTFGGLCLTGEHEPLDPAARQPRCLALLALLAAADGRPVRRDKVVAYLWPEVDGWRASHRLAQVGFSLGRDLPECAVASGEGDLRLDSHRVSTDLADFSEAIRQNDASRAVRLFCHPA